MSGRRGGRRQHLQQRCAGSQARGGQARGDQTDVSGQTDVGGAEPGSEEQKYGAAGGPVDQVRAQPCCRGATPRGGAAPFPRAKFHLPQAAGLPTPRSRVAATAVSSAALAARHTLRAERRRKRRDVGRRGGTGNDRVEREVLGNGEGRGEKKNTQKRSTSSPRGGNHGRTPRKSRCRRVEAPSVPLRHVLVLPTRSHAANTRRRRELNDGDGPGRRCCGPPQIGRAHV